MKTWLWLEDQISTIIDIKKEIQHSNISVILFPNTGELIQYLIKKKKENPESLKDMGLILDVMLARSIYISCPEKWHRGKDIAYFPTNRGYDAGLVFYENVIMNIGKTDYEGPYWNPPPPVVFLTVLHTDMEKTEQRLNRLRLHWSKENHVKLEKAKIEWLRKNDAVGGELGKLLKRMEESTK